MKRYIFTGTPGSGKTSIIHELKSQGYVVVEEAATDVIALEQANGNPESWMQPDFIDRIVCLQKQRQITPSTSLCDLQLYDRSPICTYALSRYLGYPPSACLLECVVRRTISIGKELSASRRDGSLPPGSTLRCY